MGHPYHNSLEDPARKISFFLVCQRWHRHFTSDPDARFVDLVSFRDRLGRNAEYGKKGEGELWPGNFLPCRRNWTPGCQKRDGISCKKDCLVISRRTPIAETSFSPAWELGGMWRLTTSSCVRKQIQLEQTNEIYVGKFHSSKAETNL